MVVVAGRRRGGLVAREIMRVDVRIESDSSQLIRISALDLHRGRLAFQREILVVHVEMRIFHIVIV